MANKRDISGVRTAQDLERKLGLADIKKATEQARIGLTKTNQSLNDFINTSLKEFQKLQDEIDGKVEIWFGETVPTLSTYPAKDWSPEEYQDHVGDLYYDRNTGYTYGFSEDNGYFGWVRIKDQDLSEALAIAEAAKDTADDKRRVFITTPSPPYDEGDLWFDNNSEIYICSVPRQEGSYQEGDFVIATDYTEKINTVDGKVVVLQADVANITGRITAAEADITKIETEDLTAINAEIDELEADNIEVKERLTAAEADIGLIDADVAHISTIMFGSATGEVLQTEFANAVIALISDATISNAKIISLVADKITSGSINTNKVTVQSANGKLKISGDAIIIKDDNRTRVQIGKDANKDYNIYILDADGNIMFDATGIHSDAIKNPIIVDDMVADNANISAGKINIDSLFSEINGSTNTIKSTQIVIDDEGQRLNVAFSTIETTVTEMGEEISSQGSRIEAVEDSISSKIWEQDISQATEGLATTEEMNTKYSELEQTIDGFKVQVSQTYATKTETLAEVTFLYAKNASSANAPTEGWADTYPAWEDGKYIWQKAVTTNGDGEETVIAITCITGAKGESGPQGPEGTQGIGISQRKTQYYLSTSETECTGGEWTDTMPAWISGHFLWIKDVITWTDGSVTETTPALADAINSANEEAALAQTMINESVVELSAQILATESNLRSEVSETYYSKGDTDAKFESMQQSIIDQTSENITIQFTSVKDELEEKTQSMAEDIEGLDTDMSEMRAYFDFSADGLKIGKSTSDIKLKLENDKVSFSNNADIDLAYWEEDVFHVENGEFEKTLKIGNFVFVPRASGNLSFKKVVN